MRSTGFSHPDFARIAELGHLLAGLVFPPNRQPSAEAGMRRAMATLRVSNPAELLKLARVPGDARDIVIAELTVGESYFFRDAPQLAVLGNEILPSCLDCTDAGRPIRIWSAGCASGEEPYTIAIILRELAWPHAARIVGTDIATPRLKAARRGRYTRWALRGVSEDRVAKWFRRSGNHFELDRTVAESVEFQALNLLHDDYTSLRRDGAKFDLVVCRNVMIYFDLQTVTRIATGLLDSLCPDGWLVLGASDPPLAELVPCEVVLTPGGIAYRRAGRPSAPSNVFSYSRVASRPTPGEIAPPSSTRTVPMESTRLPPTPPAELVLPGVPVDDAIRLAYERADYPATESLAVTALAGASVGADTLPVWIYYIRAIANQGRLHEAGEACARALEAHPLAAELHYLHATLLSEAGWQADAAIAARRSIYLDQKFVMGHMLLGNALTRTGDAGGARIAFGNVVSLLGEGTAPVAGADGVPAARLRQIATLRLRELAAVRQ